jgi:hypothetical protein
VLPPPPAERGSPGRPGWQGRRACHEDGVCQHGRAQLGGRAEEEDVARAGARRLAVACRRGRACAGHWTGRGLVWWSARALERALQGAHSHPRRQSTRVTHGLWTALILKLVSSLAWGDDASGHAAGSQLASHASRARATPGRPRQCCTAGHGAVERADRLKPGLSGGSRARTGVRPAPLRQPRRQRLEEHVIHAARGGG